MITSAVSFAPPATLGGFTTGRITPHVRASDLVIARIDGRADMSAVERMPRGPQRRQAAYAALQAEAAATQGAALTALQPLIDSGVVSAVESMLLPNALVVQAAPAGQQAVLDALAGVAHVTGTQQVTRFSLPDASIDPAPRTAPPETDPPTSWAVDALNARPAWASGADGRGITVGIADSGLDITHPGLVGGYRGTRVGAAPEHDYNWADFMAGSPVPVEPPAESNGHGTHVASQVVTTNIGSAPGARVIAARMSNNGEANTYSAFEALQWMLAPTAVDGSAPDPARGADVVNVSWGTGDGTNDFLLESYQGLQAAGIEVVTAAGNSGPDGRISAPASYPGFTSVGAYDTHGAVADFSSRGPSPLPDGAGQGSPTFVAPGQLVRAATVGGKYSYSFGTSMAAPLVAGAFADLMSAEPTATHGQLVAALAETARDVAAPGPDDDSGYGLVDIGAAVARLRELLSGERNATLRRGDPPTGSRGGT
ncbi:MAG: S8 family serine peptidase [Thermoleophilia bacterium]|nr:S8 family serine peptidase [Thermoleophilia bacterium]